MGRRISASYKKISGFGGDLLPTVILATPDRCIYTGLLSFEKYQITKKKDSVISLSQFYFIKTNEITNHLSYEKAVLFFLKMYKLSFLKRLTYFERERKSMQAGRGAERISSRLTNEHRARRGA